MNKYLVTIVENNQPTNTQEYDNLEAAVYAFNEANQMAIMENPGTQHRILEGAGNILKRTVFYKQPSQDIQASVTLYFKNGKEA